MFSTAIFEIDCLYMAFIYQSTQTIVGFSETYTKLSG